MRACGGGGDAGAPDGVGGVVILTGGSRNAHELRGPHDVVNLATMFGMKTGTRGGRCRRGAIRWWLELEDGKRKPIEPTPPEG